jgi:hypothetical protein
MTRCSSTGCTESVQEENPSGYKQSLPEEILFLTAILFNCDKHNCAINPPRSDESEAVICFCDDGLADRPILPLEIVGMGTTKENCPLSSGRRVLSPARYGRFKPNEGGVI